MPAQPATSTPSDIPGARAILKEAKRILERQPSPFDVRVALSKIDEALDKMTRAPAVTKARTRSQKMTPELAERIKEYRRLHPAALQQEIAVHFKVTAGRVSEALNGLWDVGAPMWRKYMGLPPGAA